MRTAAMRTSHLSDQEFYDLIMSKCVTNNNGCWVWPGRTRKGYGIAHYRGNSNTYIHRWVYEFTNKVKLDSKYFCCHKCDNPPCCNPAHIFIGSAADNTADRDKKCRHVALKGEDNGEAKLTEKEVIQIRDLLRCKRFFQREIAELYGVSQLHISRIGSGRSWGHFDRDFWIQERLWNNGAERIRPDVWVSKDRRICTDPELKTLYEFSGSNGAWLLKKLLTAECPGLIFAAARKGKQKFVQLDDMFVEIYQ